LQQALGYADFPREVSFARGSRAALAPTDFIHHWLIDGWFPLFPWLGFAVFGVQLAELRSPSSAGVVRRASSAALFIGLALLASGTVIWCMLPGDFLVRAGYSELFYPPTVGFVVTAAGLAVTLLGAIDLAPELGVYRPLQLLGESALTIYVIHLVLIDDVIARNVTDVGLSGFAVLYAGLLAAMLAVARAEHEIKARWRNPPFPARVLLSK
jgi:surface polysaccharide O-acyltransferase-like enzyme